MKRLSLACGLLAALLALSLLNGWKAGQFTSWAAQQLEQAQQLAQEDHWDQAGALTEQVFQRWQDHRFYFHAVMRHQDTDQILRAFHQVRQYITLEEMDQYAAANADLAVQLRLLGEMESAALENVL